MSINNLKFLGRAIAFPLRVVNGRPQIADSRESIEQSVSRILSTEQGSKFFLPEYGSRLHELIFEPNDDVLFALLRQFIFEAIERWEKRIKFIDVTFNNSEDRVDCLITYRILATSESLNFIFPFYKKINT